jgi:hypothetical protein
MSGSRDLTYPFIHLTSTVGAARGLDRYSGIENDNSNLDEEILDTPGVSFRFSTHDGRDWGVLE